MAARFIAIVVVLTLGAGCAGGGHLRPQAFPVVPGAQEGRLGSQRAAPNQAFQHAEPAGQDQPLVLRRTPQGQRRSSTLAFVRTQLFFGTAKPVGAVTEEQFHEFLDEVVTPLFPDGLTVIKAAGQFKGADGVTIKENSFVLVLLYPLDEQKAGSQNIDLIRREYVRQHHQESVLRVDDPFLVWVSF
jgi:hypothetical protein